MEQSFSKRNQSAVEAAYRFGDFALYPQERLLKREDAELAMQPKAFDALLCLLRRAGRLISKDELMQTLWPAVHVSEANLTNTMVSLRKVLGREAIQTVSRHGYRFTLPVAGEPGVAQATYERFARAKELTAQRSLASMQLARELYWTCLAEDPTFAPAWAWLGRCCWFLHKFSGDASANVEMAEAAFRRAFALDPDLASAHQFYSFVQTDTGRADEAMVRLLERLRRHPDEPESWTGLVQVFRFRGLLEESLAAHQRAANVDPAVVTSVAHTRFLAGEFASAIESYGGRATYYLDAAAWAALGEHTRAAKLLHERLERQSLSKLMTALMRSLLELLEGHDETAVRLMEATDPVLEPEVLLYYARHFARMGEDEDALWTLRRAAEAGFICSPVTLARDPWLEGLRRHAEFGALMQEAESCVAEAQAALKPHVAAVMDRDRSPAMQASPRAGR